MLVQVFGGGFDNRGAQLMLWTAAERLRALSPEVSCAVDTGRSDYQQRAAYGLRTLIPSVGELSPRKARLVRGVTALSRLLPRRFGKLHGLRRRCDADAFVDISGYALGDKWGLTSMRTIASRVNDYRARGKPVVLLPQMLGPFTDPAKRGVFRGILERSDLVYARDEKSFEAAKAVCPSSPALRLAPDITIWCDPLPHTQVVQGDYACLVPNIQMKRRAAEDWGESYLNAMAETSRLLLDRGVKPCVVVHDGGRHDREMALEILRIAGLPRESLIEEADPRRIKSFLAGAVMTVGSRFHALVSSLSTGRPVVALGWAHKYETLLEDFGVPSYCCDPARGVEGVLETVGRLADPAELANAEQAVRASKAAAASANKAMWQEVGRVLGLADAEPSGL